MPTILMLKDILESSVQSDLFRRRRPIVGDTVMAAVCVLASSMCRSAFFQQCKECVMSDSFGYAVDCRTKYYYSLDNPAEKENGKTS